MFYFLKKTKPSKTRPDDIYLQIYTAAYIAETKSRKQKCFKSLGYVSQLKAKGIDDPINFYKKECDKLNLELDKTKNEKLSYTHRRSKYLGHFLINALFKLLDVDKELDIVGSNYKCNYKFSSLFKTLCFAQILNPCSKLKMSEYVIPEIYGADNYSYEQVLNFVNFLGQDYHKYIEVFNKHINDVWKRNVNTVYFDCTNYYFEIDIETDLLRKGPSKENRKSPLLGQALLLDADQIPLDTEFYPGNQSEKQFLRKRIEDMKTRNNVTGRIIQVADKGLNCARNIYSAVIEGNDGYIFSKSIKQSEESLKKWALEDKDWVSVCDESGKLLYKYKELKSQTKKGKYVAYGNVEYKCKLEGDTKDTKFTVKEKRILTYNPSLAAKKKMEILKEVEKASRYKGHKKALREELGHAAKYINLQAIDDDGVIADMDIEVLINENAVKADLELAGYNMLITSEIKAKPEDIYRIYHNLWRIENSFRILKTHLEARPVYVQLNETIFGHFLICYISLTLLRLLETKIYDDKITLDALLKFMREYKIDELFDKNFMNVALNSSTLNKVNKKLSLSKLDNVYLSQKDVNDILNAEFDMQN